MPDCCYYRHDSRVRRAAGEAWGFPHERPVLCALVAATAAVVATLAWGGGLVVAVVVAVVAALGSRVFLWPVLAVVACVRPLRKHWDASAEELPDAGAILFVLQSCHDHQGQLHELRLRVDPNDGDPVIASMRALNVGEGRETYVQHPQSSPGAGSVVKGAGYRYAWSARRTPESGWTEIAGGALVATSDPASP